MYSEPGYRKPAWFASFHTLLTVKRWELERQQCGPPHFGPGPAPGQRQGSNCDYLLNDQIGLLIPQKLSRYGPIPLCNPVNTAEIRETHKPVTTYKPPRNSFEGMTTYKKTFVEKSINRVRPIIPPYTTFSSSGIMDKSEYACNYFPMKVQPRQRPPWVDSEKFEPSTHPLQSATTYKAAFYGPVQSVRKSMKPVVLYYDNKLVADMNTRYHEDFKAYEPKEMATRVVPNDIPFKFGNDLLRECNTYKYDFGWKKSEKIGLFKRETFNENASVKMASCTTDTKSYVPYVFKKDSPKRIQREVYGKTNSETAETRKFSPPEISKNFKCATPGETENSN